MQGCTHYLVGQCLLHMKIKVRITNPVSKVLSFYYTKCFFPHVIGNLIATWTVFMGVFLLLLFMSWREVGGVDFGF